MKKDRECPICHDMAGFVHDYQADAAIASHIRQEHPDEFKAIQKAVEEREKIKETIVKKFGLQITFKNTLYYKEFKQDPNFNIPMRRM